jgi:hypothetical protein
MRLRIAKPLITAIGIAAMTFCGTAAIAGANPPPDKKQHQKQEQQKPKPPQPPAQPHAQPPAQRPAQPHAQPQAHGNGQPKAQARHEAAQPRPQQPHPAHQEQARRQPAPQPPPQAQRHASAPVQHAQPAHASRPQQPHDVGGNPQRRDVRAAPQRIPPPARANATTARQVRLAPQQQQVLISQQQRRITQYRADLGQARHVAEQQTVELQRQHRTAQYRFTQGYVSRVQQQEVALADYRYDDYNSDPYFYTPADYRYYRGDRYYETNDYGINLLRDALNTGYQEGWLAGTADREDGWRSSYDSCYAYRDANYGYNGYYLDRATYNYYFREGFRRGYADGYDRSYQYGRYANGTRSLLGSVLNVVLRIERLS